jgi:O-antigen/teichoic acid export membrane protein
MASLQMSIVVARQAIGSRQAGLYAAAFALMVPMFYLPRTLATALLPRATADLARGMSTVVQRSLARLSGFLTVTSLALCIAGMVLAHPLLELVAGSAYGAATQPLRLLFAASFFLVVAVPAVNVLSATNVRDLAIPFYSSVAGVLIAGAVWSIGLVHHGGVTTIAVGVVAGSIVKTLPPIVAAHRRYRVALRPVYLAVGVLGLAGVMAVAGGDLQIAAGAIAGVCFWLAVRSVMPVGNV